MWFLGVLVLGGLVWFWDRFCGVLFCFVVVVVVCLVPFFCGFFLFCCFTSSCAVSTWWRLRMLECLSSHGPVSALLVLFLLPVLTVAKHILQMRILWSNCLLCDGEIIFQAVACKKQAKSAASCLTPWWEALLLYSHNLLSKKCHP